MLGRIDEAESSYLLRMNQLRSEQKTACRYFLGNGFCRHSHYEKAARYFAENAREWKQSRDAISKFYRFQGLGFYHYYAGRIRKALYFAGKGFESALEAGFLYGRALAADLKGHSLVQTGEVSRGLQMLELAEHLASQLGAKWLEEAVQSSILRYQSRYGAEGTDSIQKITEKLKKLSGQDIYTKSGLLLDLSQEYLRRGRVTEAKQILDECCRIVYGLQNRRHAALLNLRYAYVHYREGSHHAALNLVRNAIGHIHPKVDILLELKLRGFEKKLVEELKIEVCIVSLNQKVDRLTQNVGESVAIRMRNREKSAAFTPGFYGEDPVGDLLDKLSRDKRAAIEDILRAKLYGFLYDALSIRAGERLMYLDLEPNSLTVFDKGDVEHYPEVLSRSFRKLLLELQKGNRTKEELIEDIWKYEYHPFRHDALIYSLVAKLRKVLGKRSHWIEGSESGYHLRPEVRIAQLAQPQLAQVAEPVATLIEGPELNHRQQKILRFLTDNEFIDTATCASLFETSEITSSRDLSELAKLHLISRIGKGRATKYSRSLATVTA